MNIVLTEQMFNSNHIYFIEPVVNTVMDNSQFIKIMYSDQNIILNSVYLLLKLKITNIDQYFKKIKYVIDINHDKLILNRIFQIEEEILKKYNCKKKKKYTISDALSSGNIKIFPTLYTEANKKKCMFILKISGMWENETEYGLTYKLLTI